MAKFLFVTVGVGQQGDVAHGIEELVKSENPDRVIFLCTRVSKEKVTEPLLLVRDAVKRCEPEIFIFANENSAREVYVDCKMVMDGFLQKFPRQAHHYIADFTFGTKAMSVGFALAAVARGFERLSYVTGERGEAGRVISGTEDPRSFRPFDVYLDRDLFRVSEMFNRHQFQAAIEIVFPLQGEYQEPVFKGKVNFLVKLMRAYQEWDRFHLDDAKKLFSEIAHDSDSSGYLVMFGLKKEVEIASQIVYQEASNPFSEIRAADLYQNGRRRMAENKYDDAVARFYRLIEFLAQQTLYANHKIRADEIDPLNLPVEIRAILPQPKQGKIAVPLEKAYEILRKLGEPLGNLLDSEEMKKLQFKRNHSILAHGFHPVGKEECERFGRMIEPYLKNSLKNFDSLEKNCSFPTLHTADLEKFFSRVEAGVITHGNHSNRSKLD